MLNTAIQRTVMEGTPEEIASFIHSLPPSRYRIQILGMNQLDSTKNHLVAAVQRALSRTPEEIFASRESILKSSPKPREIPAGRTLEELVAGQWPGQETDEVINEALERLS